MRRPPNDTAEGGCATRLHLDCGALPSLPGVIKYGALAIRAAPRPFSPYLITSSPPWFDPEASAPFLPICITLPRTGVNQMGERSPWMAWRRQSPRLGAKLESLAPLDFAVLAR